MGSIPVPPSDLAAEGDAMPIAIVGIGCRLPGGASDPDKLWELLMERRSARRETPQDRFNIDAFNHPDADRNGTLNNRGGHFLDEDIAAFDAPFFSISPAEAISMDPMQRMLLEVVYEATENAGIPISSLAGSNTSCFVGCFTSDYDQLSKRDPELLPKYHSIGTGQSILANRVSFWLDMHGPSVTLDTACSSSLVAVHLACQSLRTGESSAAIVGATNAILSPDIQIGMTNLHFLSPDSTCYTFDSRANGYARGEGMAALVLKPLKDALRDGDTVRAVIRGTAVNSNGKTPGITMPSRDAQVSLIRAAYAQAGCDPAVTGYFEAHGTGTPAGDPIEASAIGEALGRHRKESGEDGKLFVGSIKTNIGHLEGASGLAGLIKAVRSLEEGVIAPNIWFEKGNPAIDFDGWRIRVPTEATPWPVAGLRRASINGFGYGGTNAHVIVDDTYHYLAERGLQGNHRTRPSLSGGPASGTLSPPQQDRPPLIFYLSAHEQEAVANQAKSFADYLARSDGDISEGPGLEDLAFTLCERRTKLEFATTVVASSRSELIESLKSAPDAVRRATSATPSIGFVFTGQGAQWWAMGRELMQYPVFAQTMAACEEAVRSCGASWSLLDELLKDQKSSRISQAEISQPICTALQLALIDLYASWDIVPTRVVGHSSGEIAAAYASGALPLASAMSVAYFRGLLSSNVKAMGFDGGMLAAGLSEADAAQEIEAMGDASGKIVVACVNSPRTVTLSGDRSAVAQMQTRLTAKNVFARKLQVDTAYHSHHMLALSEAYRLRMAGLEVVPWAKRNHQVTMFSSLTGRVVTAEDDLSADYWVDNMVSRVRFSDALTALCTEENNNNNNSTETVDMLVELGPHSVLAGPVKQTLDSLRSSSPDHEKGPPIQYLSALLRGKDAAISALTTAASLSTHGYPTNLHAANFPLHHPLPFKSSSLLKVVPNLPTYPWNRARTYWAESRLSRAYRFRHAARTDILGAPAHDWNPIEPRWRNFVRLAEQPWVGGHVVQGAVVYPAAGFCCMALQAAGQMYTLNKEGGGVVAEYRVRDLAISRALVVPQTEEGVEVVLSMRPAPTSSVGSSDRWSEFRVFSYVEADGWAEHCRGLVSVVEEEEEDGKALAMATTTTTTTTTTVDTEGWTAAGKTSIASDELYAALDAAGLTYGPEFQGIVDMAAGKGGQAVGTVQVTDTPSVMPKGFEFDRLIHPATMDAFLQMSIAALSDGDLKRLTQPYVPVLIEEITVSGQISAAVGHRFHVAAEAKPHGFREVRASVSAVGEGNGNGGVVRMRGIKCVAIASLATEDPSAASGPKKHCTTVVWEPDVDLLNRERLDGVLQASVPLGGPRRLRDFELLAYYFFDRVLNEVDETEVDGMQPHHRKFFRYMQHQRHLVRSHQHEQQTDEWEKLDDPAVASRIKHLIESLSEDADYEGRMFVRMGEALTSVLRQEVDALGLMMNDNLLYDYYTVGLGTMSTYPQVSRYITLLSHKYPDLDYLEIGAGTGGCTTPVLQALGGTDRREYARAKSYTYTDISTGFFEQAADKFSRWSDMVEFRKLDIEQDPDSQGYQDQRFDVIVAANVLHATYDIDKTIANVRKLLRPGGKLILLDMTHPLLSVALIFGNLSGWWNCTEPWREYGPLLDEGQWREVLQRHDFTDLQASSPDVLEPLEEGTRVIIASAVAPESSPPTTLLLSRTTLLVGSGTAARESDVVEATRSELVRAGVETEISTLQQLGGSQNTSLAGTAIISFVELDEPFLPNISPDDFAALKHVIQESAGLVWVTRGGTATAGTRPELSLFLGLARSLRAEREGTPCVTVDLAAAPQLPSHDAAALIIRVAQQSFNNNQDTTTLKKTDREFSETSGLLHIKRAIQDTRLNRFIATRTTPHQNNQPPQLQDLTLTPHPLKLPPQSIGTLDTLLFHPDPTFTTTPNPPPGYVDITLHAAGLNFRDILITLGDVVDTYLGNECSGIVSRVGADVTHLAVGDRVAAWCLGSFGTTVRNPAWAVQRIIPEEMGFAAAAALPLVGVTAYYGLLEVGRLKRGERVLVHAAAGGVGQMAVQIAKMVGAEVWVTVGSEGKRRLMVEEYKIPEERVFSSRDKGFADGVRKGTGGRGVDVVLNSLAGELLQETWRVVAPFGRFVEIGKRDIDRNARLEMAPFARNVTFTSVDVTVLFRQDPKLAGDIFAKVMELVAAGHVKEATPLLVQPFSKMQDSMALMQAGKHMGKIVLEPRAGDLVPVLPKVPDRLVLPADASYLLAGGLGGLGRSISRWMVRHGARNLIYVSRSGTSSSPEAAKLIDELHAAGVRTEILACDITDEDHLSQLLAGALQTMPPIRGVIQGAMVLKDQIFANMSFDTFVNTTRPKVQGSWALHRATLQQPLDFFVLMSSAASFVGNAGQANYAAGCAYQVALAAHRRNTLHLPATTIDIGKVTGVGFVAENAGTVSEQNLVKLGMLDIQEDELLAMLEMAMLDRRAEDISIPNGHIVTGVHSTNAADGAGEEELPFWGRDPVFSHMDFVRPHLRQGKGKDPNGQQQQQQQQPLPALLGEAKSLGEAEVGVLEALLRKLARSLLMRREDIDVKKPTGAYGVDSLVAVELRNWFSREARVEVPVFEILQASSLAALAKKVAGRSPLLKLLSTS
ncbi:hypothetical protein C8A00DRAFT_33947 [Chaetomidium leptoderma]|uniref:Polyketide synthase n=1 Tax=Chaetomidium leptoderma TaxID=669021 RepID=A0AAN6ZWD0_9PEZI|nr:hypothetical protein C8A00DRAFT_33947 [Chaetomidium leptoderma]